MKLIVDFGKLTRSPFNKQTKKYIFWPFPPLLLSKLKNREEFKGGLEKRKGKEGERRKKEKSGKTHVKIPL